MMGKQLSKRSIKTGGDKGKDKNKPKQVSENLIHRDEEQGWLAPASTFETEESVSPRSVETFTTGNSTTLLSQIQQDEEEEERSFTGTLQQLLPDQYLNLEAPLNLRVAPNAISPKKSIVQDSDIENMPGQATTHQINNVEVAMIDEDMMVSEDMASPMSFNSGMVSEDIVSMASFHNDEIALEYIASPVSFDMLSQQERSNAFSEEDEEIDSMVPAGDFSLFVVEDSEEFLCVGGILSPRKHSAMLPAEIDVENDLSTNSIEFTYHVQEDDQDDDQEDIISTTSSHNSYLQIIKSVTSSANSPPQRAMGMATDKNNIEVPLAHESEVEEADDDDESFHISFAPSNDLLLQAMEGASAQAKVDIERATALALSKIGSVTSKSCQEVVAGRTHTRAKKARDRVLGFTFFLFLFFSFSGNAFIQYISSSVGIDDFQLPQSLDFSIKSPSDLSLWVGNAAPIPIQNTSFEVSKKHEDAHNIACVFKVGCLAFGCI